MGLFDGIGSASIGKGGFYFLDEKGAVNAARYVVDIVKVYSQFNRNRDAMFIIEASIAWSDNPERSVGQVPSQCIMMKWDGALGMVKGFLAACNGADPSDDAAVKACFTDAQGNDIAEAAAEFAVDPSNPLAGIRLELNCIMRPKKRSDDMFTHHNWKPYNAEAFAG